ncbi:hypothetical protein C8T65DRAFT_71125 [Cerioporus squamosus]|nr:hypothetical protein C8T65DRAFT_71125 [Cerioporus squamosus]
MSDTSGRCACVFNDSQNHYQYITRNTGPAEKEGSLGSLQFRGPHAQEPSLFLLMASSSTVQCHRKSSSRLVLNRSEASIVRNNANIDRSKYRSWHVGCAKTERIAGTSPSIRSWTVGACQTGAPGLSDNCKCEVTTPTGLRHLAPIVSRRACVRVIALRQRLRRGQPDVVGGERRQEAIDELGLRKLIQCTGKRSSPMFAATHQLCRIRLPVRLFESTAHLARIVIVLLPRISY